jgi:hypothetical protein
VSADAQQIFDGLMSFFADRDSASRALVCRAIDRNWAAIEKRMMAKPDHVDNCNPKFVAAFTKELMKELRQSLGKAASAQEYDAATHALEWLFSRVNAVACGKDGKYRPEGARTLLRDLKALLCGGGGGGGAGAHPPPQRPSRH